MAEQIISPGVFTRENDLSFLPQGIGAIGAAIVGPTVQGCAFVPTVIRSFAEYERKFGTLSSETFVPQTVREYLKNAGSVTVCRVLGGGGYTFSNGSVEPVGVFVSGSGGTKNILVGMIYPAKSDNATPSLGTTTITPSTAPSGAKTTEPFPFLLSGSFGLQLSGAGVSTTTLTASLNPSENNYLFKQLGDSPNVSKNGVVSYTGTAGYTYLNFKNLQTAIAGTNAGQYRSTLGQITGYGADSTTGKLNHLIGSGSRVFIGTMSGFDAAFNGPLVGATEGYSYATTPFIHSQIAAGRKDLFRFHTIAHGTDLNRKYKVSIANLREPSDIDGKEQYSTFSVILRQYNDTDKNPLILEQYNNVNLDPDSPQYISRVIGDRYPEFNETLGKVELLGNYPNVSNFIRVEVADAVDAKATSPKLSPKGFAAVINPFPMNALNVSGAIFPSASYEGVQRVATLDTDTTFNSKGFLGWKSSEKDADNLNFLLPLPSTEESNIAGNFSVEDFSGHPSSSLFTGALSANIDPTAVSGPTAEQVKFTIPFQGGTDGIAPFKPIYTGGESTLSSEYSSNGSLYGFDLSTATAAGTTAYKKAIDILSNQDEFDINMLALPGVIKNLHPTVTNHAIDMVEGRGDAFYVMDLAIATTSVNSAVNSTDGLDTNYAAVYYPWVKVLDTSINKPILVPPSVIVPGAIAASDAIAAEWFAPAGLNRGVLGNVLEAKIRLNQAERDKLYDAKINPIATFPATGVCIWGQKTLQERSTALDRINVRRLLIALKKFIASSSRFLVFEQNTQATRNRFLNIVNPYLESVQQRQGLFAFRVQMDENNNTAAEIDRNQLVGAIFLQPTKTAEFIVLDFNVLPTGATFDNGGGNGATGGATGGGAGGY